MVGFSCKHVPVFPFGNEVSECSGQWPGYKGHNQRTLIHIILYAHTLETELKPAPFCSFWSGQDVTAMPSRRTTVPGLEIRPFLFFFHTLNTRTGPMRNSWPRQIHWNLFAETFSTFYIIPEIPTRLNSIVQWIATVCDSPTPSSTV